MDEQHTLHQTPKVEAQPMQSEDSLDPNDPTNPSAIDPLVAAAIAPPAPVGLVFEAAEAIGPNNVINPHGSGL